MEVTAEAKYIRMSPRKVRLVAEAIKNLELEEALRALKFMTKRAAKPVAKTLQSAISNAVNNLKLDRKKLKIKNILIGEGPRYKRRDKSKRMFRFGLIQKKTSHIKVILEGEK